jgi:DNA topoisomerase-1
MEKNKNDKNANSNINQSGSSKYQKLIINLKEAGNKIGTKLAKVLSTASLSDIIPVNKWWENKNDVELADEDSEIKWKHLEHNGLVFAPKYEAHGIKIKFKGNEISLSPLQEELATFWAQILNNELSSKDITKKNFFKAFRKAMGEHYAQASLDDFDFMPIFDHLEKVRERNKTRTPEEKKVEKEKKQKIVEYYGYAQVDGTIEKLSNYMVEPPGIFRGRGAHPLSGTIKSRILPSNVTLNIGPDDPVPICTLPGHAWGDVQQNQEATWLAFYKVDKASKYIFLASNSKFKGMNDLQKYEKAKKLKNMIGKIREDYMSKMEKDTEARQLGVATYLIDKLALRVGNEKGDDEADTVGCCSLRVEHVKLDTDNHIILDFLGKDSMQYYNRVLVDHKVYENIQKFVRGKKDEDNLFDLINAGKLNEYLKSLMDNLSAKVFRTYNASNTLQQGKNKY